MFLFPEWLRERERERERLRELLRDLLRERPRDFDLPRFPGRIFLQYPGILLPPRTDDFTHS